ncbi:MAG: cell wall hydrolase [Brevundimonas sp.]|uniref:cell wall hydrolase n=1 Tax=Brevundimonas sp. TaxID=1871086 RepID=UPI0040332D0B
MALLNRTTPLLNASSPRAVPTVASLPAFDLPSIAPTISKAGDRIARLRPVTAAALFGAVAGLVIGGAYLGGQAARATALRAQAERLEGATSAGFTEEALAAAAGGLDASALSIARRHDPYTVAGGAQRDRQAELLTARLETLRAGSATSGLRPANLSAVSNPAAQPFRVASALDASRDLDCLTQAAYYEARGEGREGMQAVAQVVLNRARHPAFPKSVCGVVYQGAGRSTGCQFSFTCNGAMRGAVNRAAWNRARDVASKALSGAVFAPVGNATHFHTTGVSPGWRNALIRVNQVGQHLFYRFGGRNGSRDAFVYQARPSAPVEQQPLIQASLDPTDAVRQAGQAVAYTAVLAQESLAAGRVADPAPRTTETTAVKTSAPTPAPAASASPSSPAA